MSTESQIAANRENAQLSTGPTSQEGKDKVAQNASKHGLYSHKIFFILPDEDHTAFENLRDSLINEFRAETPSEINLTNRLAQHEWLRARAIRLQTFCFDLETCLVADSKMFELYLRYQKMHEKGIADCTKELTRIRKEKANTQIGFVPQKAKAPLAKPVSDSKIPPSDRPQPSPQEVFPAPGAEKVAKQAA